MVVMEDITWYLMTHLQTLEVSLSKNVQQRIAGKERYLQK